MLAQTALAETDHVEPHEPLEQAPLAAGVGRPDQTVAGPERLDHSKSHPAGDIDAAVRKRSRKQHDRHRRQPVPAAEPASDLRRQEKPAAVGQELASGHLRRGRPGPAPAKVPASQKRYDRILARQPEQQRHHVLPVDQLGQGSL